MIDRRQLLQLGALGALGSGLGSVGCARPGPLSPSPSVQPDFVAAFLTDPHVFEDKGAGEGFAASVEHALMDEPELIVTGGDLAFDILATGSERADAQYDLYDAALSSAKVPVYPTVGNHDCLGVYEDSGMSPEDPGFGKGYFVERFGLDRPYYSFDHEGWHFVVLDTIGIDGRRYLGQVDAEQIAWLDDDLASAAKPTVVVGHIPLFTNFIEWQRGTADGIPAGVAVVNSHEVAEVLVRHPVKLVLAGHLHINEVFQYKGIEFANVGAVSGNWWNGLRDGFEEGYARLEFRGDEVSWSYVDYGWEARA